MKIDSALSMEEIHLFSFHLGFRFCNFNPRYNSRIALFPVHPTSVLIFEALLHYCSRLKSGISALCLDLFEATFLMAIYSSTIYSRRSWTADQNSRGRTPLNLSGSAPAVSDSVELLGSARVFKFPERLLYLTRLWNLLPIRVKSEPLCLVVQSPPWPGSILVVSHVSSTCYNQFCLSTCWGKNHPVLCESN